MCSAGGDFNCVINGAVDRSGTRTTRDLGARDLQRFVERAGLVDPGDTYQQEAKGVETPNRRITHTSTTLGTAGEGRQD
jgi:hypothetical protein